MKENFEQTFFCCFNRKCFITGFGWYYKEILPAYRSFFQVINNIVLEGGMSHFLIFLLFRVAINLQILWKCLTSELLLRYTILKIDSSGKLFSSLFPWICSNLKFYTATSRKSIQFWTFYSSGITKQDKPNYYYKNAFYVSLKGNKRKPVNL